MCKQELDSNISTYVAEYDTQKDAILFHPQGTQYHSEPISIYITLLRDPKEHHLIGISFTEFRMMILSLQMNGAIQTGLPLPLEDVLCIARRMSGHLDDPSGSLEEIRQMIHDTNLQTDRLNDILEYPIGWD